MDENNEATKRDFTNRYLTRALEIQRRHPTEDWKREIEATEPDIRAAVADYLRGMYKRAHIVQQLRAKNAAAPQKTHRR